MTAVAAVVVTHNRADLLAECLAAIHAQTHAPAQVVVVDNASTDGTQQVLARWPDVEVVTMLANTGGAGGFAAGVDAALDGDPDALWLLDDDTIPEPDALAALVHARDAYRGQRPTLVASRVVWTDGRDHPMNTPRSRVGVSTADRDAALAVGCRPIRSASFVSVLLDAPAVRRHGLPVADYFLWNDDFEFTTRLLRDGIGLFCPASVVLHKTRTFGATDADPGERFYFEVRNKVWMFTRSRSLTPAEKALYGASTVSRWGRTVAGSSDRATLVSGLRRGLRDGVRRGPRPTTEVLSAGRASR